MDLVNSFMRSAVGLVQRPLAGLPPLVPILGWSVITAVFALLVYKRTSDQQSLDAVKRKIHACILEIRLFNDDLRAIARAQAEILVHNLRYVRLSLKPMIFMLPPMILVLGQLHYYYGFRALVPGEQTLLKVALSDEASDAGRPDVSLDLPDGVVAETEGVWTPALAEMAWRLRAEKPGRFELGISVDGERFPMALVVSHRILQLAPVRPGRGLFDRLEFPSGEPLPAHAAVRSISLDYPDAEISFAGFHSQSQWAWMVVYFVLTMVLAFALRKPFGVTI